MVNFPSNADINNGSGTVPIGEQDTGVIYWEGSRDDDGNREYLVRYLVKTFSERDGPSRVRESADVFKPGQPWVLGNDVDADALCTPYLKITPYKQKENEPVKRWIVEQRFSTDSRLLTCHEVDRANPWDQPPRYSGTFAKYTQEVHWDKDDELIQTVSFEPIRGPLVEFDHNRPVVRIDYITRNLNLSAIAQAVDTVNSVPMWGLPVRCVKLSNFTWEQVHDGTCIPYYPVTLDFDIEYNTFDRTGLQEGTKALGYWDPNNPGSWVYKAPGGGVADKDNPRHYTRFVDVNGNLSHVILADDGGPITDLVTDPATITIQYYQETNFLTLFGLQDNVIQ